MSGFTCRIIQEFPSTVVVPEEVAFLFIIRSLWVIDRIAYIHFPPPLAGINSVYKYVNVQSGKIVPQPPGQYLSPDLAMMYLMADKPVIQCQKVIVDYSFFYNKTILPLTSTPHLYYSSGLPNQYYSPELTNEQAYANRRDRLE